MTKREYRPRIADSILSDKLKGMGAVPTITIVFFVLTTTTMFNLAMV